MAVVTTNTSGLLNPCVEGTLVEQITSRLWVKREDLCCPGGPNFSKMRGVFRHVQKQNTKLFGVLDTYHSQAGNAVARAGSILARDVVNFYPEYKHEPGPRGPQMRAAFDWGAELVGLKAGMSAVLWHQAKKIIEARGGYMMPNGLQLAESVDETRLEVIRSTLPEVENVVVSASSGTIAEGVVRGFIDRDEHRLLGEPLPVFYIHMGYSRSKEKLRARFPAEAPIILVDEGYAYKDKARAGPECPFPCNEYYDLKAWRWMVAEMQPTRPESRPTLFWNIGS